MATKWNEMQRNPHASMWRFSEAPKVSHAKATKPGYVIAVDSNVFLSNANSGNFSNYTYINAEIRKKVFQLVTDVFSVNKAAIQEVIEYICRYAISPQVLLQYFDAARKNITNFAGVRIDLVHDQEDGSKALYLTLLMSGSADEALKGFDKYLDVFLMDRDSTTDKIEVTFDRL